MNINRPVICNLNFHTSLGGTQHTLVMILSILARHYSLIVADPYRHLGFKSLLSQAGIDVETVVDLSDKTRLSPHSDFRKFLDYALVSPRYLQAALAFRRFFVRQGVDLVYINQTKAAVFAAIAAPSGVPIIYHCHGVAATGIKAVRLLGDRITHVIANSPFTKTELLRVGFSRERVTVVTNMIPIDEIQAIADQGPTTALPPRCHRPVILLAHAGIEPNKGTHLAIEALGHIVDADLSGELWITGDSSPANLEYAQSIKALVARLGLLDRVHFLGRRADIYAVMSMADVIIVPSIVKESFGRVAAEAMALGKAVVVSDRGALPSLVQDGVTGKVFDPDKPGELGRLLAQLIRNKDLREKFGQAGMTLARERFDLSVYERRLLGVFSKVLATNGFSPLDDEKE